MGCSGLASGLHGLFSPLANHSFKKIEFQPPEAKKFFSAVRKEMALLATSLPDGIAVKTFEDRMASSPWAVWAGADGHCGPLAFGPDGTEAAHTCDKAGSRLGQVGAKSNQVAPSLLPLF